MSVLPRIKLSDGQQAKESFVWRKTAWFQIPPGELWHTDSWTLECVARVCTRVKIILTNQEIPETVHLINIKDDSCDS